MGIQLNSYGIPKNNSGYTKPFNMLKFQMFTKYYPDELITEVNDFLKIIDPEAIVKVEFVGAGESHSVCFFYDEDLTTEPSGKVPEKRYVLTDSDDGSEFFRGTEDECGKWLFKRMLGRKEAFSITDEKDFVAREPE